jgi:hypothetical protein
VIGVVGVGLGAGLMLAGLGPAKPPMLLWPGPPASPAALLRSLALTRAFGVAPPVATPHQAAPPLAPPVEVHRDIRVADPIRVVIPAIDVAADVVPLSLLPDGSLDVPKDFSQTGWYKDGPEPGEVGPAVIVGHVDSRQAPAVFFRLPDMVPGNEILVETADGGTVRFVAERVEAHPKDSFPTAAVYGPTTEPVLRLITCGGTFDRSVRSYRDNVVVFARLAA